jgi:hypothetical protein
VYDLLSLNITSSFQMPSLRGRVGQVARRHAPLHTSLTDLGFKPRGGHGNQTVHP